MIQINCDDLVFDNIEDYDGDTVEVVQIPPKQIVDYLEPNDKEELKQLLGEPPTTLYDAIMDADDNEILGLPDEQIENLRGRLAVLESAVPQS